MKKRALVSVSDKTGVVDFCRGLKKCGYEIISTGGTAKALTEAGISVIGYQRHYGFSRMSRREGKDVASCSSCGTFGHALQSRTYGSARKVGD